MKNQNPIVKVISKSLAGATVQTLDGKFTSVIPWEDFNPNFKETSVNNFYEICLDGELRKQVDELALRFKWLTPKLPFLLRIMNSKEKKLEITVDDMSRLGGIVREYNDAFPGVSSLQFVEDVQEMRRVLFEGLENVK